MRLVGALVLGCVIGTPIAAAAPLRVSVAICGNRACTDRLAIAFEPARVDVQVYVPLDPRNRRLSYGLVCEDGVVAESRVDLNGRSDAPLFLRTYRDIRAGECQVMAVVDRADGSRATGRSATLIIRSRFGGN